MNEPICTPKSNPQPAHFLGQGRGLRLREENEF